MITAYPDTVPLMVNVNHIMVYRERMNKTKNGTLIGIGSTVYLVDGSSIMAKESPRILGEIISKIKD